MAKCCKLMAGSSHNTSLYKTYPTKKPSVKQGCNSLNNLAILESDIPGCGELIKPSDTELKAIVVLQIGPKKAKFYKQMTLNTKMYRIIQSYWDRRL